MIEKDIYTSEVVKEDISVPEKTNEAQYILNSSGILRQLGILGWDNIEDIILASLVTGDSLLFYGEHGECKTEAVRRIAKALEVNFQEYDAAKSMFEDIIGFPNIIAQSNNPDAPPYITTKISIWDKDMIFVDEIARASSSTQNKWMEIILSRQAMGEQANIKWVFLAMNPLTDEYIGNNPIDIALASRIGWVVVVPNAIELSETDLVGVSKTKSIKSVGALNYWLNENSLINDSNTLSLDASNELKRILTEAAKVYGMMGERTKEAASKYISSVARLLKHEFSYRLDGRRISMLQSHILALYSIRLAKYGYSDSMMLLKMSAHDALRYGITIDLVTAGKPLETAKLTKVHTTCIEALETAELALEYKLIMSDDPLEILQLLTTRDFSSMTASAAVISILTKYPILSVSMCESGKIPNLPSFAKDKMIEISVASRTLGYTILRHPMLILNQLMGYSDAGMYSQNSSYIMLHNTLAQADYSNPVDLTAMSFAFIASAEVLFRTIFGIESSYKPYDYLGTYSPHVERPMYDLSTVARNLAGESDSQYSYIWNLARQRGSLESTQYISVGDKIKTIEWPGKQGVPTDCQPYLSKSIYIDHRIKVLPGVVDAKYVLTLLDKYGITNHPEHKYFNNPLRFLSMATDALFTEYKDILLKSMEILL